MPSRYLRAGTTLALQQPLADLTTSTVEGETTMPRQLGSEMTPELQAAAKASFIHRYTGDHKPAWADKPWKVLDTGESVPYPLQFKDDAEWLANTFFTVTAKGKLHAKAGCMSRPVWPNNPELRT